MHTGRLSHRIFALCLVLLTSQHAVLGQLLTTSAPVSVSTSAPTPVSTPALVSVSTSTLTPTLTSPAASSPTLTNPENIQNEFERIKDEMQQKHDAEVLRQRLTSGELPPKNALEGDASQGQPGARMADAANSLAGGRKTGNTIVVPLVSSFGVLFLVALMGAFYYRRRQRRRQEQRNRFESDTSEQAATQVTIPFEGTGANEHAQQIAAAGRYSRTPDALVSGQHSPRPGMVTSPSTSTIAPGSPFLPPPSPLSLQTGSRYSRVTGAPFPQA
ncbi:hypothetical protein THASP1DRAFT_27880 [Thamnocephalis sphaerospora]|uniref:Transmembrane protein n=1 Tax=Thamnocephalis sphaerospora TaxID=78915 RepID=A0A4P9XVN5_9FUNG|nr:hypothetical protein THASP1DRAFT_27880 [Thamnocephalis sphaerospora]|eukprot:RKP10328.1 hypothetical protein THASP1DRAFT_27880 [Thamnocephalis sphaerospora]